MAQHPYYRIEGSDIAFVAVDPERTRPEALPNGFVPPIVAQPTRDSRDTVGVAAFDDLRADPQHAWVGQALRLAFNTELSKLDALRVYAPELIDLTARERGVDTMAAARQLAIGRVITGSYSVVDGRIHLDARIVDTSTGVQEGSDSVEGTLEGFFDLQKRLVLRLLQRLHVRVSPAEGAAIGDAEHMNIDAYRLLLESEEAIEDPAVRSAPPPAPPLSLRLIWPPYSTAYAAEAEGGDNEPVRRVLAAYRTTLQNKDLDGLAALYVSFSSSRRAAQQQYFDSAVDLEIEVDDIVVEPHATGLVVSYTRRDRFTDRTSGRAVRLEVRLTRIFVRDGDTWKIGGKP